MVFHCRLDLFGTFLIYNFMCLCTALAASLFVSVSLIRVLVPLMFFLATHLPLFIYALAILASPALDSQLAGSAGGEAGSVSYLLLWSLALIVLAVGFVIKGYCMPEKLVAHRFDIVCNSHQLWHACIFATHVLFVASIRAYFDWRVHALCRTA